MKNLHKNIMFKSTKRKIINLYTYLFVQNLSRERENYREKI